MSKSFWWTGRWRKSVCRDSASSGHKPLIAPIAVSTPLAHMNTLVTNKIVTNTPEQVAIELTREVLARAME